MEDDLGMGQPPGVRVVRARGITLVGGDDCGLCSSKLPGHLLDGGCRDFGDPGSPFDRVGLDEFLELVDACGQFAHELLVVEPFVDDDVDHGQGKGQIGAGFDGYPEVGLGGGYGVQRVKDDDRRPFGLGLEEPLGLHVFGLAGHVPSEGEDVFRIPVILCPGLAGTGDRGPPDDFLGRITSVVMTYVVRRADGIGQPLGKGVRPHDKGDGFGAELLLVPIQFLRDGGVGLIP
jgi:hypothetical protein